MLYLKCLTNINIATIARRPSDSLVGSGLAVLFIEQLLGCFGYLFIELLGSVGGLFFVSLVGGASQKAILAFGRFLICPQNFEGTYRP